MIELPTPLSAQEGRRVLGPLYEENVAGRDKFAGLSHVQRKGGRYSYREGERQTVLFVTPGKRRKELARRREAADLAYYAQVFQEGAWLCVFGSKGIFCAANPGGGGQKHKKRKGGKARRGSASAVEKKGGRKHESYRHNEVPEGVRGRRFVLAYRENWRKTILGGGKGTRALPSARFGGRRTLQPGRGDPAIRTGKTKG